MFSWPVRRVSRRRRRYGTRFSVSWNLLSLFTSLASLYYIIGESRTYADRLLSLSCNPANPALVKHKLIARNTCLAMSFDPCPQRRRSLSRRPLVLPGLHTHSRFQLLCKIRRFKVNQILLYLYNAILSLL